MGVGIGGAGSFGIAHEAVVGTYLPPTEFLPIRSESLNLVNEIQYTRPIMGVVDPVHAVPGPQKVEGDVEFEVLASELAFMLYGARLTVLKSGSGDFKYVFTPSNAAEAPLKTLSLTIVRNDIVFGYAGCVVGGFEFSVDSGVFICTMNIIGESESTESAPTEVFPTDAPYGADDYTIEIPTASAVTDIDSFTWSVDDSAEAVYRLGSAQQAAFVKFGERTVTLSVERDFENKTDYDAFKALTEQEIRILVSKSGTDQVEIFTRAAIKSSYEVNLSSQGDLLRGSIEYMGKYDFGETESYEITVDAQIDITP